MIGKFSDRLQMTVPHWFVDPLNADAFEVDIALQESFIELQNNTEVQVWRIPEAVDE